MVGLGLAIPTALITIIRLGVRARARNLGLDDAFAASSLVGLLVAYVAYLLHLDPHRTPSPSLILLSHPVDRFYLSASSRPLFLHDEVHDVLHPLPRLLLGRMVSFLHIPFFHLPTLKLRSARLSILFIVIRITPPHHDTRHALHFVGWSFGAAFGILVAQLIWVCEKKTAWKVRRFVIFNAHPLTAASQVTRAPQCPIGLPVAIAQLISTPLLRSQSPASSFF